MEIFLLSLGGLGGGVGRESHGEGREREGSEERRKEREREGRRRYGMDGRGERTKGERVEEGKGGGEVASFPGDRRNGLATLEFILFRCWKGGISNQITSHDNSKSSCILH